MINETIKKIELNFENILSLNKYTDIYVIPTKINKNDSLEIKTLKELYNEKLKKLCFIYNLTYIDITSIKNITNEIIAKIIINEIYKNKTSLSISNKKNQYFEGNLFITNYGLRGILDDLNLDYKKNLISEKEYISKEKILKKVLQKSTTKRNKLY